MNASFWAAVGVTVVSGIIICITLIGDQKKLIRAKEEIKSEKRQELQPKTKNNDNNENEEEILDELLDRDYDNELFDVLNKDFDNRSKLLVSILILIEFFKVLAISTYTSFIIMYLALAANVNINIAAIQLGVGSAFQIFGSIFSGYLINKKGYKPKTLFIILMAYMITVNVITLSIVKEYPFIMWLMAPQIGFILGLFNVCLSVAISALTPPKRVGLINGLRVFSIDLGFGVGPLIAANLYEENPDNTWYIQIAGYSATAILAILFWVFKTEKKSYLEVVIQ